MGQQQLLLIILGTIIVGIAVAGGIVLFRSGAVNAARDAVALDLEELGARAQVYYRKPRVMGGGNLSFTNESGGVIDISAITIQPVNPNGRYWVDPPPPLGRSTPDSIVIRGRGFEVVGGEGGDTVEVEAVVSAKDIRMILIH